MSNKDEKEVKSIRDLKKKLREEGYSDEGSMKFANGTNDKYSLFSRIG